MSFQCRFDFLLVSFTVWLHFNCNLMLQQQRSSSAVSCSSSSSRGSSSSCCCWFCCTHVARIHLRCSFSSSFFARIFYCSVFFLCLFVNGILFSPSPFPSASSSPLFYCFFALVFFVFLTFCFNLWQQQRPRRKQCKKRVDFFIFVLHFCCCCNFDALLQLHRQLLPLLLFLLLLLTFLCAYRIFVGSSHTFCLH